MTKPHLIASASADIEAATEPNGASGHSLSPVLPSSIARLPVDLQAALIQIRSVGRGLFGHRDTQSIFDDNLASLERLYQIGASHFDVSQVLHDIGITRADGEPLSAGTVSSAMSRAPRRGAKGPSARRPRAFQGPNFRSGRRGATRRGLAQYRTAFRSRIGRWATAPALTVTERPDPPPRRGETDLRGGRSDRSDGSSDASLGTAPRFGATVSSTLARAPPGDGDITAASRKAGELLNLLRPENVGVGKGRADRGNPRLGRRPVGPPVQGLCGDGVRRTPRRHGHPRRQRHRDDGRGGSYEAGCRELAHLCTHCPADPPRPRAEPARRPVRFRGGKRCPGNLRHPAGGRRTSPS
jgi:hypothetical protein